MKKKIIAVLLALAAVSLVSCNVDSPILAGSSFVPGATAGRSICNWVVLYKDGPGFAKFNVGATIDSYAGQTYMDSSVVGNFYNWGSIDVSTVCASTTDISGTQYDTARYIWGGEWRMFTKDELNKLTTKCKWTWCDGVNVQYEPGCTIKGYKVSGKGSYSCNSIFLPAAGSDGTCNLGLECGYYSSDPSGYGLIGTATKLGCTCWNIETISLSIRPVIDVAQ